MATKFVHSIMAYFRLSILLFLIGLQFASADELTWRLVYSSDFHGELKPCGCTSEGNLGGVLRRASRFEQLRQQKIPTFFISAGDILGSRDEQGIIKARYMIAAHANLALDAILPGERDLAYSIDEISTPPLPWVLTNQAGNHLFSRLQEKRLNDRRILIFGLLDPDLLKPHLQNMLTDMMQAFQENLKSQNVAEQDIIIVLIHADEAKIKPFAYHPLVDVIVRGHLNESVKKALSATDETVVLAAGHRGQRIGIADFHTDRNTRLIFNRIETLPSSVPDDPTMTDLYTEYDKEVSEWYRNKVIARQRTSDETSPFATVKVCGTCHTKSVERWRASRHATALKTLTEVSKGNDPECLECHSTGFGQKRGFLSLQATPELANVQCESCHGSAQAHAAYPLTIKPEKALGKCLNCHSSNTSPSFSFDRYWPRIIHHKETGLPKHNQAFSPVQGEYTLLDENRPLISDGAIVISEFFNFYCSRCYILNKEWSNLTSHLVKPFVHQQIPIIFDGEQQPQAALAYLAAVKEGKGEDFKQSVFEAKFEHDIDKREALISIADKLGISKTVRRALDKSDAPEGEEFLRGMAITNKLEITGTPTLLINNNLQVSPKNTGDNINLMLENTKEILLDIQCRQHALCEEK